MLNSTGSVTVYLTSEVISVFLPGGLLTRLQEVAYCGVSASERPYVMVVRRQCQAGC